MREIIKKITQYSIDRNGNSDFQLIYQDGNIYIKFWSGFRYELDQQFENVLDFEDFLDSI